MKPRYISDIIRLLKVRMALKAFRQKQGGTFLALLGCILSLIGVYFSATILGSWAFCSPYEAQSHVIYQYGKASKDGYVQLSIQKQEARVEQFDFFITNLRNVYGNNTLSKSISFAYFNYYDNHFSIGSGNDFFQVGVFGAPAKYSNLNSGFEVLFGEIPDETQTKSIILTEAAANTVSQSMGLSEISSLVGKHISSQTTYDEEPFFIDTTVAAIVSNESCTEFCNISGDNVIFCCSNFYRTYCKYAGIVAFIHPNLAAITSSFKLLSPALEQSDGFIISWTVPNEPVTSQEINLLYKKTNSFYSKKESFGIALISVLWLLFILANSLCYVWLNKRTTYAALITAFPLNFSLCIVFESISKVVDSLFIQSICVPLFTLYGSIFYLASALAVSCFAPLLTYPLKNSFKPLTCRSISTKQTKI